MTQLTKNLIEADSQEPLHRRVREAILRDLREGSLRPGDRLPPTRTLAQRLGVNRGTVHTAYDGLVRDGILAAHVGRGTFVAEVLPAEVFGTGAEPGEFRWRDHFAGIEPPVRDALPAPASVEAAFHRNVPDPALFPAEQFRAALSAVLAEEGAPLLSYAPVEGHPDFVTFLLAYLRERRGVIARPEEVLIANGSAQALDLIARAFLRPGDTVAVEEPSYSGALELFRACGARLVGIPVDEEGVRPPETEAVLSRERPKLFYLMPTFHNPTGRSLGADRRARIVEIARRAAVPLVEDDFDAELFYDAPPPAPLKSLPGSDGVIYIGTPSKMLFPGLRIGWVAAAPAVIERLGRIKQIADLSSSQLLQAALVRFARDGELDRHTEMVRRVYAERRNALLAALARWMPKGTAWTRPQGGMSLLVTLPEPAESLRVLREAAAESVLFSPGGWFFLENGSRHLRLCFGTTPVDRIEAGIERLARAVRRVLAEGGERERRRPEPVLPPV